MCFCACGDAGEAVVPSEPVISSSIQDVEEVPEEVIEDDIEIEDEVDNDSDEIIDLTVMSATMVYSVVYDMVTDPSSYEGRMIKMDGIFDVYTDERTGKNYYACIIQDATKCCSSGIEFELEEERIYPDEYPDNGSFITVSGVFETYEEDGILYCTLRNAKMM